METIVNKDELTFKDIEEAIYKYHCELAVKETQKILKAIDDLLMERRDRSVYRHKGLKEDHITCIYGDVPYKRVVYETKDEEGHKQYVYLLNEVLKMDMIGSMSMSTVEAIVDATTKLSFRNTAKELDRTTNLGISHQTAWNVTQKFGEKLEAEEAALVRDYDRDAIKGKKEVPVLFEEADGIYIHLQGKDRPKGKKGREIKVSTAYEGWDENGALVGKVMSVGFEDGKTFQKLREAMIKKVYDTDAVKLRVLNGDGADWVKNCEDPGTEFQLDRFHVYKKITETIKDREMQSRIRELYDECKIEELLEAIQIYADSIATDDPKDKGEKKALELLKYLRDNKEWLRPYKERGIKIPKGPEGITYKNLGTQENQNCSNITMRMKHRKCSWSISGGNHMGKILARIANRTIWEDIRHYKDAIVESDKAPIVWEILSAAQAPRYDGAGNKTGNIAEGHIVLKGSGMTANRRAFLKIFDNRTASELIYR